MIMDGRSLKLLICAFFLKQIVSLIIFLYAIIVINSSCCGARELNKLAALNVLVVLPLSSCHFDPNLNCFLSLAMIMVMGGRSLKFLYSQIKAPPIIKHTRPVSTQSTRYILSVKDMETRMINFD